MVMLENLGGSCRVSDIAARIIQQMIFTVLAFVFGRDYEAMEIVLHLCLHVTEVQT